MERDEDDQLEAYPIKFEDPERQHAYDKAMGMAALLDTVWSVMYQRYVNAVPEPANERSSVRSIPGGMAGVLNYRCVQHLLDDHHTTTTELTNL